MAMFHPPPHLHDFVQLCSLTPAPWPGLIRHPGLLQLLEELGGVFNSMGLGGGWTGSWSMVSVTGCHFLRI